MSIEQLQQIFQLKDAYCGLLACLIIMCVVSFAILVSLWYIAFYYLDNNK